MGTDNFFINATFAPNNIEEKITKLRRLQLLLQRYEQLIQREQILEYEMTLERYKKQEEKEKIYSRRKFRYNIKQDPPIDVGNGNTHVTLWKSLPKKLEE
jgi:hypothetical protein